MKQDTNCHLDHSLDAAVHIAMNLADTNVVLAIAGRSKLSHDVKQVTGRSGLDSALIEINHNDEAVIKTG